LGLSAKYSNLVDGCTKFNPTKIEYVINICFLNTYRTNLETKNDANCPSKNGM